MPTLQEQIEAEKQQLKDTVLEAVKKFSDNTGLIVESIGTITYSASCGNTYEIKLNLKG